jgi:hypothetical protein
MPSKGFDTDTPLTQAAITAAKSAGYIAAGRYLKNLTPAEVALCSKNQFGLWLIFEGEGSQETFQEGNQRGKADGATAYQQAKALGVPPGCTIFFAVDYDALAGDIAKITDYATGFVSNLGEYKYGVYGDGTVLSSLPDAPGYVAGADGWDGTEAYLATGKAALIQHATVELAGISMDPVDIIKTDVLWVPEASATTTPIPTAAQLQAALGISTDGIWGPQSQAALASYYAKQD